MYLFFHRQVCGIVFYRLRWDGCGLSLRVEKTRSEENTRKCRRIPSVQCTLYWAGFAKRFSIWYFHLSLHISVWAKKANIYATKLISCYSS